MVPELPLAAPDSSHATSISFESSTISFGSNETLAVDMAPVGMRAGFWGPNPSGTVDSSMSPFPEDSSCQAM